MNIDRIRDDFALFRSKDPPVYFDNSATTQRPEKVIEAVADLYRTCNANPRRGLYDLAAEATARYEDARKTVASFIGASDPSEIVFTRNTTEAVNLVAACSDVKAGERIVITVSEHHSNLLPWQRLARDKGAELIYMEPDMTGRIPEDQIISKITENTAIVAFAHVSNVWGIENPVCGIIARARAVGAITVVDGAQAAAHMKVDVKALDCDFYAFSGHKMLAPMGIGVLYGKKSLLEKMDPFMLGGEMIEYVTRDDAAFAEAPYKFEAGTINAGGAAGLAAACDYISGIGFEAIRKQEILVTSRILEGMSRIPEVTVYGSALPEEHHGIISFNIEGCHPHDVASILNEDRICVRAGHHCAQPLMQYMGIGSCVRASVYVYNTVEEAEVFTASLAKVRKVLGY